MENQFISLQEWTLDILEAIKKDIKSDHLHTDPVFYKTYFWNRPQNRLSSQEIFTAYEKELIKGNEELSEWVVNRWVFKNGELYEHFAKELGQINPDFSEIKQLSVEQSEKVLKGAAESFGAIQTFLFSYLNGVVFPKEILEKLRKGAEAEKALLKQQAEKMVQLESVEKVVAAHQREIARLESRVAGVQKKYATDTEALKKQIKALQNKLNGR